MMIGEETKNVQYSSSEENKVEEVPCIVRFRPREDWRGEYGFDWVREGWDDYEERINADKEGYNYGNTVKDKKASLLNNEEWREGVRNRVLDEHHKYNIMRYGEPYPIVDPWSPEQWEFLFEHFFAEKETESFYGNSLAPADKPMEYLYAPEHVSRAVYSINRKVSNAWKCKVYYENMWNGDKAAGNNKTMDLDCFIYFDTGEITSLKSRGRSMYSVFVYEESNIVSSDLNSQARYKPEDSSDEISLNRIINKLVEGTYSNDKWFYRRSTKKWSCVFIEARPVFFNEDEDFRKIASYKRVQFVERNISYDLMYRTLDGVCYLTARVVDELEEGKPTERSKRYLLKYENGCLKKMKVGVDKNEKSPDKAADEDIKRINKCIEPNGNIASNKDMTIDALSKDLKKDNIIVTVGYPGSIKEVKLWEMKKGEDNGFVKKKKNWKDPDDVDIHDQWYGKEIFSWQEEYEGSFPGRFVPERIRKEVRNGDKRYFGITKSGIYMEPILSIGCESNLYKRTKFTFKGYYDAPQKDPEKEGEYELLMRVEGKCKTLELKSSNDAVVVDQTEIQDPQDRTKLKVTFCGNKPCSAEIEATAVFEDGSREFCGAFWVVARKTQFMHICFVEVRLDNAELSSKIKDAIKDNEDALRNALSAAGIVPIIKRTRIDVKKSEIRQFQVSGRDEWDKNKSVGEKKLADVFIEKFVKLCETNPMLKYQYIVFFFPGAFLGSTSAFANSRTLKGTNEEISFVVESNSFSSCRLSAYEVAHELLHRLCHPHNFQMYSALGGKNTMVKTTPFCFPYEQTSNIMDYHRLAYSLHKFQWELMEQSLKKDNIKYSDKFRKYYFGNTYHPLILGSD